MKKTFKNQKSEIAEMSKKKQVSIGILVALEINKSSVDHSFADWANNWISNKDRSVELATMIADEACLCGFASRRRPASSEAWSARCASNFIRFPEESVIKYVISIIDIVEEEINDADYQRHLELDEIISKVIGL